MNILSFINDLRSAIGHAKANGQDSILIENLNAYLDENEKIAKNLKGLSEIEENNEREVAQRNFENEIKVAQIQSVASLELFKSVVEAGLTALKSAIIINGAAAVALLAFIGGIINTAENRASISGIGEALLIFTTGVGLAGLATGLRYINQWLFHDSFDKKITRKTVEIKECRLEKIGNYLRKLLVFIGISSFVMFFWGGWKSYTALTKFQNSPITTNTIPSEDSINGLQTNKKTHKKHYKKIE